METVDETAPLPTPPAAALSAVASFCANLSRALASVLLRVGYRLNRVLPKDGSEAMSGPLKLAPYTTATRPAAADHAGGVIYVSDGGAGAVIQASNGAAWVNLG